jgi:hypothetical protein
MQRRFLIELVGSTLDYNQSRASRQQFECPPYFTPPMRRQLDPVEHEFSQFA